MKPLRLVLGAALAAALLAPAAGRAQEPSPKNGSIELGAGPYRPSIDSDFTGGKHPYQDVFGTGRRWAFRAGYSWALLDGGPGTFELGFRTGFFNASAKGLIKNPDGTFGRAGDSTSFKVVPTSIVATYRFDGIPENLGIPLAPYLRLGLERYNWWVTDGDGKWVKKGATNGWSATAGVALALEFFDPAAGRDLDREAGINHTYLFFDVTKDKVDDFGSKKSWDLSNDEKLAYQFGLMMVF